MAVADEGITGTSAAKRPEFLRMIKEYLERRGVATVSGGSEWSIASIRGILQNEKYCGDVLRQKSFIDRIETWLAPS